MVHLRAIPSATVASAVLLALAVVSAGDGHTQGHGPGGPMPPTAVEAAKPTVKPLSDSFYTVGTIKAGESITLKPEVDGRIESVQFEEGQTVAKGAALFRIDAALWRADVTEAEANAANSARELKRAEEMSEKRLISQSDLDTRRMQAKVDAAKLSSTKVRLEKTEIRAPFAGVAGLRKVSPGAYVKAGDALVDLVQLDPLKLDFATPESNLPKLKVGQPVTLSVDAFPGQSFNGTVYAIAPQVELATRTVAMRALVPNKNGKLTPGQFAKIALELGKKDDALLIPEQALWPQGDKQFVYTIKDGKAELRPIKTGQRVPGMVEVLEGLAADDLVITAGQLKIGPGSPVQPVDAKPKAAATAAVDPKAKAPAPH